MDKAKFKCIVSALKQYGLSGGEKRFVELTELYFREKGAAAPVMGRTPLGPGPSGGARG